MPLLRHSLRASFGILPPQSEHRREM